MNAMIKPIIVRIMVFMTVLVISGSSVTAVGKPEYRWGNNPHKKSTGESEVVRIVSVLEERIEDQKLLHKTKEKLSTMSTEEIHLIACLCERIHSESHTAGADIAFLLITVLIVLL